MEEDGEAESVRSCACFEGGIARGYLRLDGAATDIASASTSASSSESDSRTPRPVRLRTSNSEAVWELSLEEIEGVGLSCLRCHSLLTLVLKSS